jgi:pentose-5-phosphate-3-epimerase
MISNPDQFIDGFADAGSDYISVHVEITLTSIARSKIFAAGTKRRVL